jgi:hypothetical protein
MNESKFPPMNIHRRPVKSDIRPNSIALADWQNMRVGDAQRKVVSGPGQSQDGIHRRRKGRLMLTECLGDNCPQHVP